MEIKNTSLLTVEEARSILRIGRNVMYSLVAQSDFPSIRIGKQIRIPYESLTIWIKSKEQSLIS